MMSDMRPTCCWLVGAALVLSVAKEHLRKIELFGALFGFLIGLVQVLQFYFYAR